MIQVTPRSRCGAGGTPSPAASAKVRAHQRASQQGNVASMLAIGDAYYYGRGLPRDWPTAFKVYTSASRFRNAQVPPCSLWCMSPGFVGPVWWVYGGHLRPQLPPSFRPASATPRCAPIPPPSPSGG